MAINLHIKNKWRDDCTTYCTLTSLHRTNAEKSITLSGEYFTSNWESGEYSTYMIIMMMLII